MVSNNHHLLMFFYMINVVLGVLYSYLKSIKQFCIRIIISAFQVLEVKSQCISKFFVTILKYQRLGQLSKKRVLICS